MPTDCILPLPLSPSCSSRFFVSISSSSPSAKSSHPDAGTVHGPLHSTGMQQTRNGRLADEIVVNIFSHLNQLSIENDGTWPRPTLAVRYLPQLNAARTCKQWHRVGMKTVLVLLKDGHDYKNEPSLFPLPIQRLDCGIMADSSLLQRYQTSRDDLSRFGRPKVCQLVIDGQWDPWQVIAGLGRLGLQHLEELHLDINYHSVFSRAKFFALPPLEALTRLTLKHTDSHSDTIRQIYTPASPILLPISLPSLRHLELAAIVELQRPQRPSLKYNQDKMRDFEDDLRLWQRWRNDSDIQWRRNINHMRKQENLLIAASHLAPSLSTLSLSNWCSLPTDQPFFHRLLQLQNLELTWSLNIGEWERRDYEIEHRRLWDRGSLPWMVNLFEVLPHQLSSLTLVDQLFHRLDRKLVRVRWVNFLIGAIPYFPCLQELQHLRLDTPHLREEDRRELGAFARGRRINIFATHSNFSFCAPSSDLEEFLPQRIDQLVRPD